MKNYSVKRLTGLLIAMLLSVCLLSGMSVFAAEVDHTDKSTTMLPILNSQTLYPQSTGYADLDNWIDTLLSYSTDQSAAGKFLYAYQWSEVNIVHDISSNYSSYNRKYVNMSAMHPYDTLYDFIGTSGYQRISGMQITMPDSILNHFYYVITKNRGACFDSASFVAVVGRYIGFDITVHTGVFQMESWSGYSSLEGHGFTVMTLNDGTKYIFDSQRDSKYAKYMNTKYTNIYFGVRRDGTHDAPYNDTTTSNNHYGATSMSFNELNCNADRDARWLPLTAGSNVKVTTSGNGKGTVSGAGFYTCSNKVVLKATAGTSTKFEGWYDASGKLVSSDATYSFYPGTTDVTYTAKFTLTHTYTPVVTAPTCTAEGYTTYTCSDCGDSYKADKVPALGHDLSTTCDATCTAAGKTEVTCSRCDYFQRTDTPALGHDYQVTATTATCFAGGESTYTCSRCTDTYTKTVEALGHDWQAWYVTKPSTATEPGEMTHNCSRCTLVEVNYLPAVNPFTDVAADQYYYIPILWAFKYDITKGMSDTEFAPNMHCTRGQVVTFLWRAAGKPTPSITSCAFTDVAESDYYYDAVLWAVENNITAGTSDTTFSPNNVCTRAQIVTFLWRAAGKPAPKATTCAFTDVAKSDYYYDAVLWAVENGITVGMSETAFAPNVYCTRGQVVTFLYRWKAPY